MFPVTTWSTGMPPAGIVPLLSAKMIGVAPVIVEPGTTLAGAAAMVTLVLLMIPASAGATTNKHPRKMIAQTNRLAVWRSKRHRFHDIRTHLKVRISKILPGAQAISVNGKLGVVK